MPAKGSTFDNDLLQLIFNGTTIANIAINATVSPLSNFYVSLHTGSPGIDGYQNTNEATYVGYDRVAVARSSGGWVVSGSSVAPVATIVFPAATGGSETENYFAIGIASSGPGKLLYFGGVSPTITVVSGITPQLTTGSTITEA